MGDKKKKNIIIIINGEITFPKNNPNLNQTLFKGLKILEFINPKTKKIKEIIKDHTLISSLLIRGYKAINKNTIKKTIPKLRLELILTLFIYKDYDNCLIF